MQEATLALVWQHGARVFAVDTGEAHRDDSDDPMRTAIRQVMGVFAELDRKMVARRLRDGRAARATAGRKAIGDYPFGYTATGKGRERDARPIEAGQKVVTRIVELRRAGPVLPRDRRSPRRRRAQAPTGRVVGGCSRARRHPAGDRRLNRVLTEALAGRCLSRGAARRLAASLRGSRARYRPVRAIWPGSRAAYTPPPTPSTLKLPHRRRGSLSARNGLPRITEPCHSTDPAGLTWRLARMRTAPSRFIGSLPLPHDRS